MELSVTVIKLLVLFALVSCGNNVKLKDNKLESLTPLSGTQLAAYQKQGLLIKGSSNQIQYQGQTYLVSIYSSKSSENFIKAIPTGSQVPVIFTGGVSGNQIVVETIQRQ